MPVHITSIPDVAGIVRLIARGIVTLVVCELVDVAGTIRRPDGNSAELLLQWLQQFLAKMFTDLYCQVRVIGNVGYAVDLRCFAVEEVTQEEAL